MTREEFVNVAEVTLDSLPEEFRSRIRNVAILVEDLSAEAVTIPAGSAKTIAARHLSRSASHQEERL